MKNTFGSKLLKAAKTFKQYNDDISQQAKELQAEKGAAKIAKLRDKRVCPRCGSTNVEVVGAHKGFSVGKAVAGAALTGGIGAVAGFLGKEKGSQWVCKECGKSFVIK